MFVLQRFEGIAGAVYVGASWLIWVVLRYCLVASGSSKRLAMRGLIIFFEPMRIRAPRLFAPSLIVRVLVMSLSSSKGGSR